MNSAVKRLMQELEPEISWFARELVRIPSITGHEGDVARLIRREMETLGYDRIVVDELGSVCGVMGSGPVRLMFDSHVDTVAEGDASGWEQSPFSGNVVDGKLYGRGSADMKGGAAASVYAGYAMKKLGLLEGKTVLVSTSVMEEDFDGEALYRLCVREDLRPHFVVICEPSNLALAVGQRGRALLKVTVQGVPSHGSKPFLGKNAVYGMQPVIRRVEALSREIEGDNEAGSLALTRIESEAVSLNAVPSLCRIYLDRRLTLQEDEACISKEMDKLLEGTDGAWEVHTERGVSYTGADIALHSFLPAWRIGLEEPLAVACIAAHKELAGRAPEVMEWEFSTNGVATAGRLGIPTIGLGPGDPYLAHTVNEYCPVSDILGATEFYTLLPGFL